MATSSIQGSAERVAESTTPWPSSPSSSPAAPHPQPETAAACRALLAPVGLADRWTDCGPDELAARWLTAGDRAEDRPAELTADQWTMLRACRALADGEGGPQLAELLGLERPHLYRLASFLTAWLLDAQQLWSEVHHS